MGAARGFRTTAAAVVVAGLALGAPPAATALSTRSASDTTLNSQGLLVATAACKRSEHVVSGGYESTDGSWALTSRARGDRRWTAAVEGGTTLTVHAYCSSRQGTSERSRTTVVDGQYGALGNGEAGCGRRQRLVAGGYATRDADAGMHDLDVFRSHRSGRRAWSVSGFHYTFADFDTTLEVFAYCRRRGRVRVRSSDEPIAPNAAVSSTARCRRGEQLLSGGYATTPASDFNNASGPNVFYFRSARTGPRAWTATGHNYSNYAPGGVITAFAYCKA